MHYQRVSFTMWVRKV